MKNFKLYIAFIIVFSLIIVMNADAGTFKRFAIGVNGAYYEPDGGDLKELVDDQLMVGGKARVYFGNEWAIQGRYGDWNCEKNEQLYSFLVTGKNDLNIKTLGGELLYIFSKSKNLHSYVGVGAAQYKTTLDYIDNNIDFQIENTFTGYTLCAGGDLRLHKSLFLNGEIIYTHADDVVNLLTITGSNYSLKLHGVMANMGLIFHF